MEPVLVDHDVQGSWSETGPVTGSGFEIALTETAGVVTGTGMFSVEAGRGGTLAVSGSVRSDSLHLQVVFVPDPRSIGLLPDTTSFVGALVARDTIDGTLTDHSLTPQSIQLIRR